MLVFSQKYHTETQGDAMTTSLCSEYSAHRKLSNNQTAKEATLIYKT